MLNESNLSIQHYSEDLISKKRTTTLLEILVAFLPLIILGIVGTILGGATLIGGATIYFGYLFSILVASVAMKRNGTGWREIGMARPKSWPRTVLLGFGTAAAALLMILVLTTIATNLPGTEVAEADISRFNPLEGNLPLLIISVVLAWTAVAFGEEMIYRAFLINQLGTLFQSKRLRWTLSLIFSSIFFGLVHFYQGPLGIVLTGLTGLLFGLIYLKSNRNLWAIIIAHGLIDTFTFVLVFLGMA
ncbi:MAG: CPBP family intramembrane metalloprotease [Chloroflexota bacterium]|nr:MAG: CPBP family intramembrane metalloprotease [Chloroflexota bacterium]